MILIKKKQLKLKKDFEKIQALTYLQLFFLFVLQINLFVDTKISIVQLFINLLLSSLYYRSLYKLKSKFNYSYWTLGLTLLIYFFYNTKYPFFFNVSSIDLLYFTLFLLLFIEMYLLSSPIYYSRVMWWEYDYRYRDDLKIELNILNDKIDARLTDLRRKAGCILCFRDLRVGLIFEFKEDNNNEIYKVKIVSKRVEIYGRPIQYGVKFILLDNTQKLKYNNLSKLYRDEKRIKKEQKLSEFKKNISE